MSISVSITKGPALHRDDEYELPELDWWADEYCGDNVHWVLFRSDITSSYPAFIFSDYERLRDEVSKGVGYGRVEPFVDGINKLDDEYKSHSHFGYDPNSETFALTLGECDDCSEEIERLYEEENLEVEAEVLLRKEEEIDGHPCVMEIYRCPLCNKVHAELGVEEYGILGFNQEYEGEEFVIEELFSIFSEKYLNEKDTLEETE